MTLIPSTGGDSAPIRTLGIGGSTRRLSKSRVALGFALQLAADAGAQTTVVSVPNDAIDAEAGRLRDDAVIDLAQRLRRPAATPALARN
jgi:hypothetical protein